MSDNYVEQRNDESPASPTIPSAASEDKGIDLPHYDCDTLEGVATGSPYKPALKVLYRKREDLKAELAQVEGAIAALEPFHEGTKQGAVKAATPQVNGVELSRLNTREAAEVMFDKVNRPLTGGELRTLLIKHGKPIEYRLIYNTLKKRKKVFRQLPDKRWVLVKWPTPQ
jgi:hypothetical protein